MKTKFYILIFLLALSFTNCNQTKKEDTAVSEKKVTAEKKEDHKILTASDSLKLINHKIDVKGEVEFPLEINVDSLKKMNVVILKDLKIVCQSGEVKKDDKISKGVLLKDILEKAKIIQNGHKDRNFYIVARASDDYKATFSWAEIFNNPTGQNVYVLFEENGKPIKDGDMILISANDIKTGPRHVKWLKSIEVYKVK